MQHEHKTFANIKVNSLGHCAVIGDLNFTTVQELQIRGCQLIAASPLPIFDCKQVTSSDNAGIALLLSWIKYAKNLHKAVKFLNVPPQLLAIIKASGLYEVICKNG